MGQTQGFLPSPLVTGLSQVCTRTWPTFAVLKIFCFQIQESILNSFKLKLGCRPSINHSGHYFVAQSSLAFVVNWS